MQVTLGLEYDVGSDTDLSIIVDLTEAVVVSVNTLSSLVLRPEETSLMTIFFFSSKQTTLFV